ncbi:MAG: hypothetical protein IPH37_04930 [Burkholderiales bacterium]|nr:hypothetical protein [Burkholderiales bacterium]
MFGPSGSYVDVPVTLNNPAAITHVYLRCNSCGYDDIADNRNGTKTKATLRINGGAAIALKHFIDDNGTVTGNGNISVIGGEAKYGGIGGTFRSVRFTVKLAANQLRTGANTLRFEHVTPAAPSMGFRIIDVNFLENGDINRKVLASGRDVVFDDPTRWTAPRPGDTATGQALWTKRNALYDEGLDLLDGRGGKQGAVSGNLSASCADCHTKDGRDLKFFNFSNHAITQRAVFHGMSKLEGEQIASYIRSNRAPVTKRAWPWNPTYQPGPGLDSNSSAYEWAAGAGIDAVLDDDREIAKHLFPGYDANNPPSLDGVRQVVNRFGKLNFRELPINIPMPEWNQWLPLIHPDDAFNTDAAVIRSTPGGTNVGKPYYTKMVEDAMDNPTFETLKFSHNLKPWLQRGMTCSSNQVGDSEPWRGLDGNVLEAMRLPRETITTSNCLSIDRNKLKSIELAKRGLSAWSSVKMWEIMHGKALEEASRSKGNRVCISGTCVDGSEARGWYADGRNVFDRPPHFTAVSADRSFLNQSPMQGILSPTSGTTSTWCSTLATASINHRISPTPTAMWSCCTSSPKCPRASVSGPPWSSSASCRPPASTVWKRAWTCAPHSLISSTARPATPPAPARRARWVAPTGSTWRKPWWKTWPAMPATPTGASTGARPAATAKCSRLPHRRAVSEPAAAPVNSSWATFRAPTPTR